MSDVWLMFGLISWYLSFHNYPSCPSCPLAHIPPPSLDTINCLPVLVLGVPCCPGLGGSWFLPTPPPVMTVYLNNQIIPYISENYINITRILGQQAAPYSSCSLRLHQCGGVCQVEVLSTFWPTYTQTLRIQLYIYRYLTIQNFSTAKEHPRHVPFVLFRISYTYKSQEKRAWGPNFLLRI